LAKATVAKLRIESGIIDGPLAAALLTPAPLVSPHDGGIASFIGVVRDHHLGLGVRSLRYECYEAMAAPMLRHIVERVAAALPSDDGEATSLVVRLFHGVGEMVPGDVSLVVQVSSAHRVAAFGACRAIVEAIKADLPVWKEERYDDGSACFLKGS
jgi:molybdopterin synthase catalytic subunit